MNEYYYLDTQNVPQGPHTLDQLAEMMTSGRVNPTTLIACKGASSWEPLGSVLSRENVATPDVQLPPGQVGNCPSCGHELSADIKDCKLPANCPSCNRSLWSGIPGINFWANYCQAFRNYAKFSGRATRAEYWCFQAINFLICIALYIVIIVSGIFAAVTGIAAAGGANAESLTDAAELSAAMSGGSIIAALIFAISVFALIIYMLYILVPSLSLSVRRLHDVGWSGKWLIPYFIICFLPTFMMIPALINPDDPGAQSLSATSGLLQLVGYGMGLFFFVLTLLDSKRGANKYGPSSKYPLG